MGNHVLLNSAEHKDLKVVTQYGEAYGDNIWFTLTFPQEFRSVQAHYPVFFHKDPKTGQFHCVALFGLKHNENLFLDEQGWNASYIPLTVRRQPFLIGQQRIHDAGEAFTQRVIHIDMDSPRISETEGEALFHPYGGNTPYLEEVADMLEVIHHGLEDSKAFVELLQEHDLLESFTLEIELDNGDKHSMHGFYTINEPVLESLSAEVLDSLHKQGYLQAIYMALASQSNVRDLMNRVNQRLS
ncbi:SapC family protein [Ferrimonas marina]|uniref:SapC protein n=1 Tax=Ferrimonas marina TaxID=299255 RepID=A0A1M5YWQ1_9GAMM|nr:SapC family protein [Ferrimonas marina]SHI16270.1 SapC protein [Ferrimonas marina]